MAIPLLLIGLLAALDCRLLVRRYKLKVLQLSAPVRIALVSDLHASNYGKGQHNLLEALHAQNPDLVLMTGDMFDEDGENSITEEFLAGIAGKYPCYYVTGNHEYYCEPEQYADAMEILRRHQITVLSGTWETVTVKGQQLNICGVDDPYAASSASFLEYATGTAQTPESFQKQVEAVSCAAENGQYTVLLSHRPELFENYYPTGAFDLVLSGHAHGGQWRIPLLLNGLYAPGQGLFPKYAGGVYQQEGCTLVVSRGLARGISIVPRLFTRPELVVIELT